ncbi:MAG: sulfatase-like hydrolase/transferase [Pseudomonadota bacterium]
MRLVFCLLILLGTALVAGCVDRSEAPAPHIVVLIADDLGLDQAPCHSPNVRMPYLQSLCGQALVFDRAYTHPYCTASRAALMTGRHPFRHGADDVRMQAPKLPLSEVTIAELIKQHSDRGYRMAAFGKWHLADDENGSERNPNLQGFEHYEGTPRQKDTYRYTNFEWTENGAPAGLIETYKTMFIMDRVIAYFRSIQTAEPVFSIVSFTSPHKPFHSPPEHLHSFGALPEQTLRGTRADQVDRGEYRANRREPRLDVYYFAMLEALDIEISRLVQTLEQDTDRPVLFVFLGDNGSAAEVFAAVDDERVRSKATVYDGGVRVPLMIWGEGVNGFRRSKRLVHLADLFPTLAEIAGVEGRYLDSDEQPIDGVSFRSEVDGFSSRFPSREFSFFERGNDAVLPFAFGAVDQAGLKLILRETVRQTNYSAGRLIEIYDTESDMFEAQNLFDTPCDMPGPRVLELFEFIASKASQNEAHSDWFDEEFYRVSILQALNACVSRTD